MRSRNPLGPSTLVSGGAQLSLSPIAYTPTVTWAGNTIGTQSGFYIKTPGLLFVWVSFTETAGTASAALTVTLPTGYTAVTHTASLSAGVGQFANSVSGATLITMVVVAGGTAQITSPTNVIGAVTTYSGCFVIPTLT